MQICVTGLQCVKKIENPSACEMRCIICFWEQFDHPPYSKDLAPSDFHLFLYLKSFLAGQRFHDDEVKEAVLCNAGDIILR
jgi:hypothetical protein